MASRHGILSYRGGAWTQDLGLRAALVGVAVAVRSLFVSQYRLRSRCKHLGLFGNRCFFVRNWDEVMPKYEFSCQSGFFIFIGETLRTP